MVIIFADAHSSTEASERYGEAGLERIREQLAGVERVFTAISPDVKRVGSRLGDGIMLAAPRDRTHAIGLVRDAITLQAQPPAFLPLRIALGVGDVTWDEPGTTYDGPVVTLTARLEKACPPGGVAVNEELWSLLSFYAADLRPRFAHRVEDLAGLGPRGFWVAMPAGVRADPASAGPQPRAVVEASSSEILGLLADNMRRAGEREDRALTVIERNASASERLATELNRLGEFLRDTQRENRQALADLFREMRERRP